MGLMSRRGALLGIGVAVFAACRNAGSDDLGSMREAVGAASPRVVNVLDAKRQVDGLGHALYLKVQLNEATPVGADELDAIVAAIWSSLPWEPNGITLTAVGDAAGDTPVDLRTAAEGLKPMLFDPFGKGGISIIGMQQRYGEWKKPA